MAYLVVVRVLLYGRFGSTHALVDDWYNHAQYFPVFALGIALVSYGFIAWYFVVATDYATSTPPETLRTLLRVAWGANEWATIATVLGFAHRLRHADGPALRYLVPAVLPVYILHQTVTVVLAHNLEPFELSPAVEGPALVALTFGLSFAGHEVIGRSAWLRPLFGLRPLSGTTRSSACPGSASTQDART